MKVHSKEVATLRQYIALSTDRLACDTLERHIISEGLKLGIQFGNLYYDGSTHIYDFDGALNELIETSECPIIYKNGTAAIEILEQNSGLSRSLCKRFNIIKKASLQSEQRVALQPVPNCG